MSSVRDRRKELRKIGKETIMSIPHDQHLKIARLRKTNSGAFFIVVFAIINKKIEDVTHDIGWALGLPLKEGKTDHWEIKINPSGGSVEDQINQMVREFRSHVWAKNYTMTSVIALEYLQEGGCYHSAWIPSKTQKFKPEFAITKRMNNKWYIRKQDNNAGVPRIRFEPCTQPTHIKPEMVDKDATI